MQVALKPQVKLRNRVLIPTDGQVMRTLSSLGWENEHELKVSSHAFGCSGSFREEFIRFIVLFALVRLATF